jgi:hypothetical protein
LGAAAAYKKHNKYSEIDTRCKTDRILNLSYLGICARSVLSTSNVRHDNEKKSANPSKA